MGLIYVDNAATTAVFPEVVAAMHQTISNIMEIHLQFTLLVVQQRLRLNLPEKL